MSHILCTFGTAAEYHKLFKHQVPFSHGRLLLLQHSILKYSSDWLQCNGFREMTLIVTNTDKWLAEGDIMAQRKACLLLRNQDRKKICFPRSLPPVNVGTTGITWKTAKKKKTLKRLLSGQAFTECRTCPLYNLTGCLFCIFSCTDIRVSRSDWAS